MRLDTRKKDNRNGFTLIELLMVSALLAVISLALYTTFSNGIKIWQRAHETSGAEALNIFFDKFISDLCNGLKFSSIGFTGRPDGFEFATLVNSRKLQNRTVGKVEYSYDKHRTAAIRAQMDFADIYGENKGIAQALLADVTSLAFQYYVYDTEKKEYIWQDEIAGPLPIAVRMELEVKDGAGTKGFTKTVGIPANGA